MQNYVYTLEHALATEVLISRCTDPKNFELIGIPPVDMIEDIITALSVAIKGFDVTEYLRQCALVTTEFLYDEKADGRYRDRFKPKKQDEKTIPVRNKTLAEILDPQPKCSAVLHKILAWIDSCDYASQNGEPRPPCINSDGTPIIPTDDIALA